MKKLIKIFTMAMSLLLVVGTVGVSAANYEAIPGTDTELTKYLVVNEDAEIPEASFEFTVSAGQAKEATETTVKVWAGINPELVKVNGELETGTVEFVVGEEATSADAVNALGQTKAEGKKAAKKTIALDFSGVQFTEPGVYRYLVTETEPESPIKAVDSRITTVDVYVEDNNGVLEVKEYVAYEGDITNAGPLNHIPVDMSDWDAENAEPRVMEYDENEDDEISPEEMAAFEADLETYYQNRNAEFERRKAANAVAVPNGAEASEPKDDKFVNELASAFPSITVLTVIFSILPFSNTYPSGDSSSYAVYVASGTLTTHILPFLSVDILIPVVFAPVYT